MDPFYLTFILIPVGVSLGIFIYYSSRKKQMKLGRTKKLMRNYIQSQAKKKKLTDQELANLQRLFENKSIDKDTYERLTNVLKVMGEKKPLEVEELLDYVAKNS